MKKILVTTDFSTASKAALRFAIQLKTQHPFELTFFHSFHVTSPTAWSASKIQAHETAERKKIQEKLDLFVKEVYQDLKIEHEPSACIIKSSVITQSNIMDHAAGHHFDFICISTRGAGRLKRLLGTNTANIINHSTVPVIAVPHNYKLKKITKILYASDLAELDSELKKVTEFAGAIKADVEVFHFTTYLEAYTNPKAIEKASEALEKVNIKVNIKFSAPFPNLVSLIEAATTKTKPSMLVMFTQHHRTLFDKIFSPSASAEYSYHPHVPLLVFNKAQWD
ncbi:universal stress protein [Dyadobacter sp. 3J3]|uniref:universal stress protein n=1 Tax=Dyadobacter sp. 3J3 TaxID=2606600 RepID=UPI00135C95FF|nr:universal stress protein [Dyadobacter sp. 3J3]